VWLKLGAILTFLFAIGPVVALHVYEVRRWRRETGRKGGYLAMRFDSDYQRAERQSGRAYLFLPAMLWFLFGFGVFSHFLDAL
jgi:hypothetical protein